MPTYDYACPECGQKAPDFLVENKNQMMLCHCGALMDRAPSCAAFKLKGSGWENPSSSHRHKKIKK